MLTPIKEEVLLNQAKTFRMKVTTWAKLLFLYVTRGSQVLDEAEEHHGRRTEPGLEPVDILRGSNLASPFSFSQSDDKNGFFIKN